MSHDHLLAATMQRLKQQKNTCHHHLIIHNLKLKEYRLTLKVDKNLLIPLPGKWIAQKIRKILRQLPNISHSSHSLYIERTTYNEQTLYQEAAAQIYRLHISNPMHCNNVITNTNIINNNSTRISSHPTMHFQDIYMRSPTAMLFTLDI